MIGLAASTGMRRSEILGLRWLDIDLPNRRILLPQTKNGDGRIVYLNQSAQAVIQSLFREGVQNSGEKRIFSSFTPE